MARTTTISFAQVAQIADGMKAAGSRPTARAVRERIGSGSMGTIHKLLQQYNGETASDDREAAELPESIGQCLMEFVANEIATACEPLEGLLQHERETSTDLAGENERLERLIEELQEYCNDAKLLAAEAVGKNEALKQEIVELRNDRIRLDDEINCQRLANGVISTKIEVLKARNDAANERVKDYEERCSEYKRDADRARADAMQANTHYQACAARLDEAARTIDRLSKKETTVKKTTVKKPAKVESVETE